MYKLIEFIRSIYVVLLFVVIEAVAINYYARSSCYTQARLLARSNQLAGGMQGAVSGVKHFFTLGRENRALTERVGELEAELAAYRALRVDERLDSFMMGNQKPYVMQTAHVVSNSINKNSNFLVINKGTRDGVTTQMAVLSADGAMAGYIVECSSRYSVAVSILNTSFRASGKVSGGDYSGSIHWNGTDPHHVTMEELSKYARPKVGDEVISTGFSSYFPADIMIGTVAGAELNESKTAYTVSVKLAVDMTALGDVILVRNVDLPEIEALRQSDKVQDADDKK